LSLLGADRIEDAFIAVGGVRVHYQRAGSGLPLLLLHGLVGSSRNWRRNITFLAQNSAVYAIDLFNMGESDRVFGLDASLEATADRIVACMDALGLAQADIAAHSHGGAIAMMLASRHPERVRRLILFAPANPFCDLGRQLIRFYCTTPGRYLARLVPWIPIWAKSIALSRMYGDPSRIADDALAGYTVGLDVPGTMDHILQIVRRWYVDMGALRSALGGLIVKPTLLVWGDQDRAVGLSSGRQLQQILPQSQLMVLHGVGHIAFEELPDVCNEAMRDWLSSPLPAEMSSSRSAAGEAYGFQRKSSDRSTPPMVHGAA
jgi:4,5:9,10-diseco-3-hydroxy-5,9,17-trioxoandrosta-1(10),2-diene-4-oate hydrolase